MEENYCDIKKITENTYMIGTYQRGYRWDENNVMIFMKESLLKTLILKVKHT